MSKYQPLADRLGGLKGDDWRANFSELEKALGFPLPKAARGGSAWWANDPAKPHNRAWLDQGWRVEAVDRAGEVVTFRRRGAAAQATPPAVRDAVSDSKNEVKRAAGRTALIGGAVALAAGLGALALRAFRRRA